MSTESRRWERVKADMPVTLLLEEGDDLARYRCLALDLSPGGLRIRSHLAPEPGQLLKVIPFVLSDGAVYVVRSRVAWVGASGSDLRGQLGLEFLEPSRRRFMV